MNNYSLIVTDLGFLERDTVTITESVVEYEQLFVNSYRIIQVRRIRLRQPYDSVIVIESLMLDGSDLFKS